MDSEAAYMGLESKYQAECVRIFLWKRLMFIDPVKGDGNCLFNAVLQEMEFDTQEDEDFYTSDRLRRQVVAFFTGTKEKYVNWIRRQIRNICNRLWAICISLCLTGFR